MKKLIYTSQLLRLQLEYPHASTPAPSELAASVESLLADPLLVAAASSKEESKDSLDVARLLLDLRLSALLAFEAVERAEKNAELAVRLERQLRKYREDRERSEKLKAQQMASKAGAIAAAVKVAKASSNVPLTQAEEEAEITRKVSLKLDREFLERNAAEKFYADVLATPAPTPVPAAAAAAAGTAKGAAATMMDPSHCLVHERLLARMVLQAHVAGVFTSACPSADLYASSVAQIESKAREIVEATTSSSSASAHAHPSPYASRILLGLTWTIGGPGADSARREQLLKHQAFVERCIFTFASPSKPSPSSSDVSSSSSSSSSSASASASTASSAAALPLSQHDGDPSRWSWMAWHALASCMVSTECLPSSGPLAALPPPPGPSAQALAHALASLGQAPSVFEAAAAILKNVTSETTDASASSAAASASSSSVIAATPSPAATVAPLIAAPSPFIPSFLSLVTLSYALQKQSSDALHKETLLTIQQALSSLKSWRSALPFDPRGPRSANHAELTLAAAYGTKVLDQRIVDSGVRIYARILKTIREGGLASDEPKDGESVIRALQGLAHAALQAKPRPAYELADQYVQELVQINPHDEYVWSMRGLLKLQEARAVKEAAAPGGAAHIPLLQEAATFMQQALKLCPNSPSHQLRLGQAYFEQDVLSEDGADGPRTHPDFAKAAFQSASSLAARAGDLAPRGSAAESTARKIEAEALAMQGLWAAEVAADKDAAKKLFVAALKLDPSNDIAGPALCEFILASTSEIESARSTQARVSAVHALASRAVSYSPRCVWAWVRLARCQVSLKEIGAAIVSYQNALRIEDQSRLAAQCWQELAQCYNAEGQFIAAYKSIAKCVELSAITTVAGQEQDPAALRTHELNMFLLAKSQLSLGGTGEAIASLETATSSSSSAAGVERAPFLPALKLLAEALYVQASLHVQSGAFESARTELDRAVATCQRCIALAPDQKQEEKFSSSSSSSSKSDSRSFVSLWKLLGDCYALYNSLPVDDDGTATATTTRPDLPLCEQRKLEYLERSTQAYGRALQLDPTVSEHWYDAALSQFKSALALHAPLPAPSLMASSSVGADGVDTNPPCHPLELEYRSRGLAFIKSALLLCPSNTLYWHLLGVLDPRPLVRQHALIQAVTQEPKDCMGWTSLGLLYLQQSHDVAQRGGGQQQHQDSRQTLLGLSRHALEVSQTLDPANPALWMSQGLFNAGLGTLEAYVQARACFERSLELYPSALARFGLAYTAYCTGDIALARFAILKFVQQYPRHASAWNLAGLIFEHVAIAGSSNGTSGTNGTIQEAVDAFGRAEELLAVDTQFSVEQRTGELLRMVRVNRARALASAGHFEASIALYQALILQAAELASSAAGTTSPAAVLASALTLHVALALVYARAGQLEQATHIQATAAAIASRQIEMAPEATEGTDAEAAAQMRHEKSELINKRRALLLQQAQLHALNQQYDACKQLLQQSVSEYPEFPHPLHYFDVMCALYASSLQQSDLATAEYAVGMMSQCLSGLLSGDHAGGGASSDHVMQVMLPAFYRIQAQVATLKHDHAKARRMHAKLIQLSPGNMAAWNELYTGILSASTTTPGSGASTSAGSVLTILRTASLPSLWSVHAATASPEGSTVA